MRLADFAFVILLAVIAFVLAATWLYKFLKARTAPTRPQHDISTTPGDWYSFSDTDTNGYTRVGIQYVTRDRNKTILERRVLKKIDCASSNYAKILDSAQDEAYEAQRVANLGLYRR